MKKLLLLLIFTVSCLFGQATLNTSLDVASGNVWRGVPLEKSAVIVGTAVYSTPNVELGVSGTSGFNNFMGEQDLWLRYRVGKWYVHLQDYYYPNGSRFSNFKDKNNGSHSPELGIGYSSKLSVYGSAFIYNDTTYSPYLELRYSEELGKYTSIEPFIAGTYGDTFQYGTSGSKIHLVNYGIAFIRKDAGIPAFTVTYITNPVLDYNAVLVKLSLF